MLKKTKNYILIFLSLVFSFAVLTHNNSLNIGSSVKEWDKPGNEHLKLKCNKNKILSYKTVKRYGEVAKSLKIGAVNDATSSTQSFDYVALPDTPTSTVEYTYISDQVATETPYFSNGEDFSRAQYIKDNTIAFYEKEKWHKDSNGTVNDISEATTTLEAFNGQISLSFADKFVGFFIPTAIATTSYTATGTTTYNPGGSGSVWVLVVAGGGGGGGYTSQTSRAGGGGAGGIASSTNYPVTAQNYTVTVGDGGAGGGGGAPYYKGATGTDSVFDTLTAKGGGGGGSDYGTADSFVGGTGGCGGGGSGSTGTGGTSTQGYIGGTGFTYTGGYLSGGGGGGMGSVGGNAVTPSTGGAGGNGATSTISGSAVCYAGGGGGGRDTRQSGSNGAGRCGGGSGTSGAGTAGTANRGGGGGGGSYVSSANSGGKGGSGIVILQFTASSSTPPKIPNIINFE